MCGHVPFEKRVNIVLSYCSTMVDANNDEQIVIASTLVLNVTDGLSLVSHPPPSSGRIVTGCQLNKPYQL